MLGRTRRPTALDQLKLNFAVLAEGLKALAGEGLKATARVVKPRAHEQDSRSRGPHYRWSDDSSHAFMKAGASRW